MTTLKAVAKLINEIFLRHRQQVLAVEDCPGECSAQIIATGLKNLECMGYTLDGETIAKLARTGEQAVIEFFERTQYAVNALVLNDPSRDARLKYKPMYPGFPEQVMEASSAELFVNALVHYITNGEWLPEHGKAAYAANSGKKFVPFKLRVLKCGSLEAFKGIFINLMNSRTSISGSDAEDLKFFFENFEDAVDHIPAEPVFKENTAIIAGVCVETGRFTAVEFVERFGGLFKTGTDVLRLAAVLSGGDPSLAEVCRFRNFTRKERKALLKLLDGKSTLLEDMFGRREVWLRLGEKLHPGEYTQFSHASEAFRVLRQKDGFHPFAGKVEMACRSGFFDEAVKLLSQRPGEFARALDRVLRNSPDQELVLNAFEAVAERVSSRILLEVRTHFLHRSNENFAPMIGQFTPEELREREKAEEACAEERKKYDEEIAKIQQKHNEAAEHLREIEAAEARRLSAHAVRQSTFNKSETMAELRQQALEGDALAAAVNELAAAIVESSFIAAGDENWQSLLKKHGVETPYERESRRKAVRPALDAESVRVFFPKGSQAKSFTIENTLTGIPAGSCQRVAAICEKALKAQYARRESLGKVWISDELKDYLVPFSQRSASKALRTIVRGSRLRFSGKAKVVRGFIWWKNGQDRTDLDLTALMVDKDWKYVEHISFTNLRSPETGCCHSGDIVDAPKVAAEYIDIDLEKAQKAGVRYVVFSVYGYTMQDFCDLPECSFGWMEREKAQKREIFDASGIGNKIDLAMASTCGIPVIFDLQNKCAVWMDMATATRLVSWNCVESNAVNVLAVCRGMVEMHKPNLYDLAMLHAQTRGELVNSREEAEVIFAPDEGITPFEAETWMSKFI